MSNVPFVKIIRGGVNHIEDQINVYLKTLHEIDDFTVQVFEAEEALHAIIVVKPLSRVLVK